MIDTNTRRPKFKLHYFFPLTEGLILKELLMRSFLGKTFSIVLSQTPCRSRYFCRSSCVVPGFKPVTKNQEWYSAAFNRLQPLSLLFQTLLPLIRFARFFFFSSLNCPLLNVTLVHTCSSEKHKIVSFWSSEKNICN